MASPTDTAGIAGRGLAPDARLRTLAALTELSAHWLHLDGRQLVEQLADELRTLLDLDFVCIAVTGMATQAAMRITRGHECELCGGGDADAVATVTLDSLVLSLNARTREGAVDDAATLLLLRSALHLAAPHLKRLDAVALGDRDRNRGQARDRFLVQLDSALRPLTDPAEMTLTAATLLGRHLDVDRCAYADIEDDEDTMNLSGNYLREPGIRSIVGRLHFHDFGAEVLQLMRDDKPYVVDDIDTHVPAVTIKDAYRATQIQAVICVPLHKNGRFVAAMAVHQARPRVWTQDEVELVMAVAARCWESIERSRVEREVGKKYASLFMQTPIAICVLEGPSYIYRLANPAYLTLVSRTSADILNRPVFEALPELKDQGRQELLDEVFRSGKPYFGKELPLRLKRGEALEPRYVDFIYQPRFDAKGEVDGIMVIAEDVTDKVDARLNLEGAVHELRATTDENRRLLDEMRNTDRRKDEFLATLAHELRNPLAPIKNSLEILRNTDDKTRIARLRDIMDSQLTHLIRLVDDLLDMARINEGKIELRKERITIQAAIEATLESSRWQINAQRHEFATALPQEPIHVAADPTRLMQVISNLLSNAAKYTPPGGKITLSAKQDKGMALITVTDNGIGIPPDMTEHIFEPFTQLEVSKQHARGGMGIGLSLVKRLIEMHGGFVKASSAGIDKGSAFTVGLPLADAAAQPAHAPSAKKTQPVDARNLRVLVVDDNVDSARTLGWMLETKQYQPVLAYNGEQALAMAYAQRPDVILLDLGLPDISGYEVCRELRKSPAFKNTLIVAQTGWGQKQDRDRSYAAGFDQHLVKPIHMDDVEALLAAYRHERPA